MHHAPLSVHLLDFPAASCALKFALRLDARIMTLSHPKLGWAGRQMSTVYIWWPKDKYIHDHQLAVCFVHLLIKALPKPRSNGAQGAVDQYPKRDVGSQSIGSSRRFPSTYARHQ